MFGELATEKFTVLTTTLHNDEDNITVHYTAEEKPLDVDDLPFSKLKVSDSIVENDAVNGNHPVSNDNLPPAIYGNSSAAKKKRFLVTMLLILL